MRHSRKTIRASGVAAATALAVCLGAAAYAADGRSLYKSCAACHGPKGEGVAALNAPAIAGYPAWYMSRQLKNFAAGIRGGAPGDAVGATMRAAATVLKDDAERSAVADHVASLKLVPAKAPPPMNAARQTNGRNYFNALCSACHNSNGRGNQQLGAPRLGGVSVEYLARQFSAFKAGRRGGHPDDKLGAQMRAIAAMLPDAATEQDVLNYAAGLAP